MKQNLGGVAGWLLERWRGRRHVESRLALVERIALAPRQSLVLVEAEGRKILVATSAEGAPAFYPLDQPPGRTRMGAAMPARGAARKPSQCSSPRISW